VSHSLSVCSCRSCSRRRLRQLLTAQVLEQKRRDAMPNTVLPHSSHTCSVFRRGRLANARAASDASTAHLYGLL